jgi:Zn-dependent protease with chaperone function
VTNSSNVNGYVTALCPRRVFITQGLFKKLEPTDDELAFLIGHELGVSRFGAQIPD